MSKGSDGQLTDGPNKNHQVLVVKDSYWKTLYTVQQSHQLHLCQTKKNEKDRLKYEIVFKDAKIYSLCRVADLPTATDRFTCLKNITNIMFHPSNPYRRTSLITSKLQNVIDTSVEHPTWRDVHIAAYVSGRTRSPSKSLTFCFI